MKLRRIIPCLLLRNNGLVKTVRFRDSTYVGDPINTIRIFNEKEADELMFLDIDATKEGREPSYSLIEKISGECFMPFSYGGGVSSLQQIEKIIKCGAEKIVINTKAAIHKNFVKEAVDHFGSSTIVVSIDVKKDLFRRYSVYLKGGTKNTGFDPVEYAKEAEALGAGEILLNSVDRDGTMEGYDIGLICSVARSVRIPVIACGGASKMEDFRSAIIDGGASAAAAGSFFVFHGKRRAVLITYPSFTDIISLFE